MSHLDLLLGLGRVTLVSLVAFTCGHALLRRRPESVPGAALAGLLSGCVLLAIVGADWPTIWQSTVGNPISHPIAHAADAPAQVDEHQQSGIGISLPEISRVLQRLDAVDSTSPTVTVNGVLIVLSTVLLLATGRIVYGLFATVRLHRTSVVVSDPRLTSLSSELVEAGACVRELVFRSTARIDAPCVTALDQQCVYLPANWTTFSNNELAASVAHEAAHLSRRDALWRLLAQIATSLQIFHPVAHGLLHQLVLGQELSADHRAARAIGPQRFIRGISELALRLDAAVAPRAPLGIGVSHSSSFLIRRITMLRKGMSLSNATSGWLSRATVLAILVAAAGSASWTLSAEEKKPVRVATRTATTTQAATDNRIAGPWTLIPGQTGYWSLNVETAWKDPVIAQWLSQADSVFLTAGWNVVARTEASGQRAALGLTLSNVAEVGGAVTFTTEKIEDPESEQRFRSNATSNEAVIHFRKDIDWNNVAGAFAEDQLDAAIAGLVGPEFPEDAAQDIIKQDIIADFFSKQASPRRFLFSKDLLAPGEDLEERPPTPDAIPALWKVHKGTLATMVVTLPDTIGGGEDEFEQKIESFHKKAQHYIVGIDPSDKPGYMSVRLGFSPRGETSLPELRTTVADLVSAGMQEIRRKADPDSEPDETEIALLKILEDVEPEIVESADTTNGSAVILKADVPISALPWVIMG